jgi:hypothetical protein
MSSFVFRQACLAYLLTLISFVGANAQQNEEPKADDTTIVSGRKFKLIFISNPTDTSALSGPKDKNIDLRDPALKKERDEKKLAKKTRDSGMRVDLGVNGFLQDFSPVLMSEYDSLELRYGKSVFVNLTQLYGVPLIKHNVVLFYGYGLELANYRFEDAITLVNGPSNGVNIQPLEGEGIRKTKLAASYLHLPLMLQFRTGTLDAKTPLKFSVGGEGALLLSSHTKIVRENEGDKQKDKVYGQQNLNPFKLSGIARVSIGDFGIFARYGFTDMFKGSRDDGLSNFSLGLTLTSL